MADAYSRYLNSPHWKAFRLEALEAANNLCSACGDSDVLIVHHKHYETLGAETLGDVDVFCRRCHQLKGNGGFVPLDFRLVRHLSSSQLRIYSVMKMDAIINNSGQSCTLRISEMGEITGYTKAHVCNLLKSLTAKRIVDKQSLDNRRNQYYFTNPDNWELDVHLL